MKTVLLLLRLASAALFGFGIGFAASAFAQAYPTKPIRILVPFPPGGAADLGSRIIGQKMTENWGQPVIIDNRPGANTIIGAEAVAKAAPDGYTLLMAFDSTLVLNQSLYSKLPYDPIRDFAPITRTFASRQIMVTNAATGPKSVKELIQQAKANPGKLTYGAGSTASWRGGALFISLAEIDMVHVPYKGSPPAVQGLLAGDVTIVIDGVSSSLPHIKSGKLRALAGLSLRPIATLPDVPSLASEANLPGFDVAVWQGLVAPAGTPAEVVNRLNGEVVRILGLREVQDRLAAIGNDATPTTPEEFAAFIRMESERWSKVIKQAGIRIE